MIDSDLQETKAFLQKQTGLKPTLAFVLGSGLSGFVKKVKAEVDLPFARIPHFAPSNVEGHPGRLVIGHLEDVPVAVLCGRLHAYEGLSMNQVIYPVRSLAVFGIRTLVVTNAAGGL